MNTPMDLSRFDGFQNDEKWIFGQDRTWPYDYYIDDSNRNRMVYQRLAILAISDNQEIANNYSANIKQRKRLELAATAPELLAELKRERELSARFKNALEKIVNDFESIKKSDGCYGDRATAFAWTAQIALGDPQKEAPATPAPDKIEHLKKLHHSFLIDIDHDYLSRKEKACLAYAYGFGRASVTFFDSPTSLDLAIYELRTAYQQALTEAGV